MTPLDTSPATAPLTAAGVDGRQQTEDGKDLGRSSEPPAVAWATMASTMVDAEM